MNLNLAFFILLPYFFNVFPFQFYSQSGQDKYLLENIFPSSYKGTFIDIGAYDGITWSNSYAFEQRGWKGICIEPNPTIFQKLTKKRSCTCIQAGVSSNEGVARFINVINGEMLSGFVDRYDPRHLDNVIALCKEKNCYFEYIDIPCYSLTTILDKHLKDASGKTITHIDLLCIDTEGGEFEILKSLDWNRFTVDFLIIEELFEYPLLKEFLKQKGFVEIAKMNPDVIYKNKNVIW